ncbi:uracil-DNA glycosylase-like protein [Dichomitus squalens]|uniref:Uracil-DNA glycosylase-like protein n=1 Tax=Dichomitus squalens TaxID=114155 RepID=A0A4Q9MLA8_9APHY|nr:uracil-DNA glycosylase-like protein [Dichomitus squalens]
MSSSVDSTESTPAAATPTQELRNKLSTFRFNEELTPSLRPSPRNHRRLVNLKCEEEEDSLPALGASDVSTTTPSRKRARSSPVEEIDEKPLESSSPKKRRTGSISPKKRKRTPGIAPTEKYVHLDGLSDHLGDDTDMLDVMFCGINPGQMSATIGHHFAHPTNHFWKCLYGSQLTDRLLNPREDGTLPKSYSLGLTNLVERPSAQAAELANTEFTAGVPALFQKIIQRRPRIVCFVGKGIWDSFIRATAPPVGPAVNSEDADIDTKFTMAVTTSVTSSSSAPDPKPPATATSTVKTRSKATVKRTVSRKAKAEPFVYDLQPYKVIHTAPDATVHETLFSVVVSTSGLVAGYQLPEKIKQFSALKKRVDELRSGTLDTSSMTVLPIPKALLN